VEEIKQSGGRRGHKDILAEERNNNSNLRREEYNNGKDHEGA
jgi:hypothetical protein